MHKCRRYRVAGVVQGVGFRYHTQRQAVRLGLVGWVQNHIDGGVEVVACGPVANLDKLGAWLRTGPAIARVKSVTVEALESTENLTAFSIR